MGIGNTTKTPQGFCSGVVPQMKFIRQNGPLAFQYGIEIDTARSDPLKLLR